MKSPLPATEHDEAVQEKLKIISFSHKSTKGDYFLCKCDCGKEKVIRKDHINKDIKSCGCSRKQPHPWQRHENPKYGAIHTRLYRERKKTKECVYCGSEKRLEWASIYHTADKNLDNYIPLCASCHRKYDMTPETKRKIMRNLRWVKYEQ